MVRRLAALTGIVLLAAACQGDDGDSDSSGSTTSTRVVTVTGAAGSSQPIPNLVQRVQPSVVSVVTEQGQGSGVVFDAEGFVITNHHVAGDAGEVEIVLASGETVPAELQASTAQFDIAVLKVDRQLPAATFATALPVVGELAIALGNPSGFENSVTAGIVSGLNRDIPAGGTTQALVDLIQTDAAISPGNSGGALVDGDGEVIGINVAYLPPTQGAVSLGFAIPAPIATEVARQLIDTGEVEVAYLGIQPAQVTPELDEAFDLGTGTGVLVEEVVSGSPAAEAGIRERDVIVRMDDSDIESVDDLFAELRDHKPGEEVTLTVVRDGERRNVDVTLGEAEGS
jgi:S1-C subfamily serine protease